MQNAGGFSLGDHFNTSNVWNMSFMFAGCNMPEGFSLGDKFDTSGAKGMEYIFNTDIVGDIRDMFYGAFIGDRKIEEVVGNTERNAIVEYLKSPPNRYHENNRR